MQANISLLAVQSAKAADETPELMVSVIGDMRLVLTDSQGRKSGILEATGEVVNEIPETEIEANDAGMRIVVSNAVAGQFSLAYYGTVDRDFSLYVTASDTNGELDEYSYDGYRPEHGQTLSVGYNPTQADQLSVQPVLAAPSEYESASYDCAGGKCTRITWKASQGAGVSQYMIYRSREGEPFYSELARVPAGTTSYNTNDPWDVAEGFPVNGYSVSAIKTDSTESFFAKEKENVNVYTKFPWTMFLPAITGH